METIDESYPEPVETGGRGRTTLIATCAVLVVISCCCLLGAGLVVYWDPLDWNLIARLTGRYDAAAEAVPPDAAAYIGIDLSQLESADADRVFRAFAESAPDSELSSSEDFLRNLDEEMEKEAGFNLSDDILPWVGQYAGVGITDLQLDEFGEVESGEFVFAATIRNRAAAEAFALLLRERIAADSGETLLSEEYEGATIYSLPGYQGDGIAFAIHRGTFLLSMTTAAIRASVDAKAGESFMDTETFREFSGEVPADAFLTLFATEGLFEDLTGSINPGVLSTGAISNVPFRNGAFSLSFVPQGIRFDFALHYDPDTLSETRRQQFDLYAAETTIDARLPGNTLAFLSGRGLDLTYALMREQMEAQDLGSAFDESIASLDEQLGFSVEDDLLANLDGEFAIAILPSSDGPLASQDIALGLALLFETSNPSGLEPVLSGIADLAAEELGLAPEAVDLDGTEFFQVGAPFIGELIAYGLVDDLFMITTSARTAGDVLADGPALPDDADYRAVWQTIPEGMNPILYVNLAGLLGSIREGMGSSDREDFDAEIGSGLSPIEFIAMGNRHSSPEVQLGTLIVFVTGGN
jgi:hypothetical protein